MSWSCKTTVTSCYMRWRRAGCRCGHPTRPAKAPTVSRWCSSTGTLFSTTALTSSCSRPTRAVPAARRQGGLPRSWLSFRTMGISWFTVSRRGVRAPSSWHRFGRLGLMAGEFVTLNLEWESDHPVSNRESPRWSFQEKHCRAPHTLHETLLLT